MCTCLCFMVDCLIFFFSSRRRHTRWTGDWSSDVCSSDLKSPVPGPVPAPAVDTCGRHISRSDASLSSCFSASLPPPRSEERRVGKECRSRRSEDHLKKKRYTVLIVWYEYCFC